MNLYTGQGRVRIKCEIIEYMSADLFELTYVNSFVIQIFIYPVVLVILSVIIKIAMSKHLLASNMRKLYMA